MFFLFYHKGDYDFINNNFFQNVHSKEFKATGSEIKIFT